MPHCIICTILCYCNIILEYCFLKALLCCSSTSASVKSYQLVKVVSGGRAPGKSSILASPQLLVIERFFVLGPCAWKKFIFSLLR